VRCGKSAILQTSANATLDQTKMFAQQVGEVYRCHGQWKGKADAAGRRAGNGRKRSNSEKPTVALVSTRRV
jgi:hypothetical protein